MRQGLVATTCMLSVLHKVQLEVVSETLVTREVDLLGKQLPLGILNYTFIRPVKTDL